MCEKSATDCKCKGGPYAERPTFQINEPFFRYLMMMTSQFCAAGVSLGMGIPYAKALETWNFSGQEISTLYGPGHKVLEKWVPFWLVMFQDEIALAIVLLPILTAKMVATTQVKSQLTEEKRRAQLAAEEAAPQPPRPPVNIDPVPDATGATMDRLQ